MDDYICMEIRIRPRSNAAKPTSEMSIAVWVSSFLLRQFGLDGEKLLQVSASYSSTLDKAVRPSLLMKTEEIVFQYQLEIICSTLDPFG